MGAEHKDSDPGSVRGKKVTDPGVGPSGGQPGAMNVLTEPPLVTSMRDRDGGGGGGGNDTTPDDGGNDDGTDGEIDGETTEVPIAEETADVVDFDALNAALGVLPPAHSPPVVTDSEGRSSATYSSARPHFIPATRAPQDDLNAPAVIVFAEDPVPNPPPVQQMTMPMNGAPPPSNPRLMVGGRPPSPSHPFLPTATEPYVGMAVQPSADLHQTPRMMVRPRRPRHMTIVMRERGPSRLQKAAVFVTMLVVFVAGGIAFLIYKPASGMNLNLRGGGPLPPGSAMTPAPTVTATPSTQLPAPAVAPVASIAPGTAAPASAAVAPPVASVKKPRPAPRVVEKKDPIAPPPRE